MKYYLFSLILSASMLACKSNKLDTPQEAKGKILTLKHGGGFAGNYKTFYLIEDGQLWKGSKTEGVKNKLKSLPKDVANQIFSNYDVLGIDKMEVVTYGNLLYSISMEDGDETNKVSWEKGDKGSEKLQLFYRNVMNHIKKNNEGISNPKKSSIKAKF